jgi:hypothetical protein
MNALEHVQAALARDRAGFLLALQAEARALRDRARADDHVAEWRCQQASRAYRHLVTGGDPSTLPETLLAAAFRVAYRANHVHALWLRFLGDP